jgi:hypothetical protein
MINGRLLKSHKDFGAATPRLSRRPGALAFPFSGLRTFTYCATLQTTFKAHDRVEEGGLLEA